MQASSSLARANLRLPLRRWVPSTAACCAHGSGQLFAGGPGQEAQERRGQAWRQHQRQRWGPASVLHQACAAPGSAVVSRAAVGVAVSYLFRFCGAGKSVSVATQRIAACTSEETHWRPSVTATQVRSRRASPNTAHSTAPGHSNACSPRWLGRAPTRRQPRDPGRHGGGDAARAGLHKPVPVRPGAGGAGGRGGATPRPGCAWAATSAPCGCGAPHARTPLVCDLLCALQGRSGSAGGGARTQHAPCVHGSPARAAPRTAGQRARRQQRGARPLATQAGLNPGRGAYRASARAGQVHGRGHQGVLRAHGAQLLAAVAAQAPVRVHVVRLHGLRARRRALAAHQRALGGVQLAGAARGPRPPGHVRATGPGPRGWAQAVRACRLRPTPAARSAACRPAGCRAASGERRAARGRACAEPLSPGLRCLLKMVNGAAV